MRSLVIAGLGAGLMREDLALAAERAGAVAIWPGARLETTLQFIHARERTGEPAIAALVALVADTWNDDRTRVAAATEATAG